MEVRRVSRGVYPFEAEEAANFCFDLIAANLNRYAGKKEAGLRAKPKSILVVAVIDCLSILSETPSSPHPRLKSNELLLL
jgi:hypothetical protein